ncbi:MULTISPECIES: acetyl-CoA carboxylase biotin carboxyl carrier protein subunit [Bizionia]|uniref:Acetyl-CoA carboxylase biotin carboxyl carrier protein subunit n=1 Tax=Bizionia algoritergicola TaxID=291187 RepID=A0A5D0QSW5_9FLAO|nr:MULTISPECIES: acetyl-CoA carboxylase biotin carboxyl carrier protein subunit [Bizionia]OBX21987.1 acetyl-CoA carboxylase biotin carboxyl carrier protein subunit [Bizionia sp. APA-3]TYB72280.1 acetyl-CoA carboxylase biotin carboxyl carrier protein subunit [Bizionia algoritergicola]
MSQTYRTKVNNIYDFDLQQESVEALDSIKESANNYHILSKNKSYKAEILQSNFNAKQYQIKINGTMYQIAIEDYLDVLIKELGFEIGASKQVNDIKAPMPGLILDIAVKVGQEVHEDDTLLILEAMKMENVITSPRSGVIKSISVNQGDAVDKNQLLIEFE